MAATSMRLWRLATLLVSVALFASESQAQTLLPASHAAADRLVGEVREAKDLAQAHRAAADTVDDSIWIGTRYNEVDVQQHTCYALGLLLGLDRRVQHLRFDRNHVRTAKDADAAHDLRVDAQSMDNFASVVTSTVRMPPDQWSISWNLDCVGQHNILPNAFVRQASATFYESVGDGRGIKILGPIETGFANKLKAALDRNPRAEFVALGSDGGSVVEAMAAGGLIRSRGLTTVVWNNCRSACPLVFVGGVDRHVHSPYPSLGFHQIYSAKGTEPFDSPLYKAVAMYLSEMGVDTRFIVDAMQSATPTEMKEFSGSDVRLCQSRIATWIQRSCSAKR